MQAINYPGACLANWKKISNKSDLTKEVIRNCREIFEKINKIKDSPALSFSFPGYKKASETHYRQFSNSTLLKGRRKINLLPVSKNVQIIYGSRWKYINRK